jgi:hypothetical protein
LLPVPMVNQPPEISAKDPPTKEIRASQRNERLRVRWLGGRHARRPRCIASASDGWQDVLAGIRVVAGGFRDDAHVAAGVTAEVEHRVGARDCRHGNVGNAAGRARWDGQSIRVATVWLRDEPHQADKLNNALGRVAVPNKTLGSLITEYLWGNMPDGMRIPSEHAPPVLRAQRPLL